MGAAKKAKESVLQRVADFFNISDAKFLNMEGASEVTFLEEEDFRKLIPDGLPFQLFKKAVYFINGEGKATMLGEAYVSERECKGHFPEIMIVPLAKMAHAFGLVGTILLAEKFGIRVNRPDNVRVSMAYSSGKVRGREIVKGPRPFIIKSVYQMGRETSRGNLHQANIEVWLCKKPIDENGGFSGDMDKPVLVATGEKIGYTVMDMETVKKVAI